MKPLLCGSPRRAEHGCLLLGSTKAGGRGPGGQRGTWGGPVPTPGRRAPRKEESWAFSQSHLDAGGHLPGERASRSPKPEEVNSKEQTRLAVTRGWGRKGMGSECERRRRQGFLWGQWKHPPGTRQEIMVAQHRANATELYALKRLRVRFMLCDFSVNFLKIKNIHLKKGFSFFHSNY